MDNLFGIEDTGDREVTDRYLIFYHKDSLEDMAKVAGDVAGIHMLNNAADAEYVTASAAWREDDTIVVPQLGVAICSAPPEQMMRLAAGNDSPIKYIRKELVFSIAGNISADFLRGYQAATNNLIEQLLNAFAIPFDTEIQDGISFKDSVDLTWGLQSIGVGQTQLTGKGIKVAILDTGIDFNHPDVKGRSIVSKSFITGIASAQDDNGHGTHCAGTLCGPIKPFKGPRYGVAPCVELFVGKVMKSDGKGNEGDILHGIGWAIQNKCRIISLSIGQEVGRGAQPVIKYEEIGQTALDQNCLIIAAAGNDSSRPDDIAPVSIPANSSTIFAVGAVDRRMNLYSKSNGGLNPGGGAVDIIAPGVDVYSSKPAPFRYGLDSGTSMATPHVSGTAALLMEQNPNANASEIWKNLTEKAKSISLSEIDSGAGIVQI